MNQPLTVPWWEALPADFRNTREDGGVLPMDRLKVVATAALDRMTRTQVAALVAATAWPRLSQPDLVAQEFEALRFYEDLARNGNVDTIFMPPRKDVAMVSRPVRASLFRGGVNRHNLSFASEYQPLNPAAAVHFDAMEHNTVSHAQYWRQGKKPRPTLIVVHGYGSDSISMNSRLLDLEGLYRRGYDILIFTYPHHGARAEPGAKFSGQGVFAHGLLHFNEVALHAIHDLRVYIDYLRAAGVVRIGVTGISMGGYTAALLADVVPDLAFCIPIVPAVSTIDTFLEWQPTGFLLSRLMQRQGVDVARMRGLVAIHNPLSYAPRIAGDKVLIIGGAGDRFTSPRHMYLLQRHFKGSGLHWFPGNHILHMGRSAYLGRMREHMDHCTRSD